jgi:hypothetical protein
MIIGTNSFRADACTSGQGPAFVYAEPNWNLSPDNCASGAHVGSCYYMKAEDARVLAAQLLVAADKADAHNGITTTVTGESTP